MNTETLRSEIAQLKKDKAALQAHCALFEKFISMVRSPEGREVINAMLRETIEISIELTGAELGSLILVDKDEEVVDSILSRSKITPELSSELIEAVLEKGLAGWVKHHRKIGRVDDTDTDDRWWTRNLKRWAEPEAPHQSEHTIKSMRCARSP